LLRPQHHARADDDDDEPDRFFDRNKEPGKPAPVEDMAVRSMVKSRKLSKVINRTGWGQFRALPTDTAQRCGLHLFVVDRRYPSSKTLAGGHLLASLSLQTCQWTGPWTCPGCGTRHNWDINAATNIRSAAGLAADACGVQVSRRGFVLALLPVTQELPHTSLVGIPVL
jgi:putative transposase